MANTDLYSRLKRLFSTSAVVRHVGGKKLKVVDTDHIAATMSNGMRERYSRVFTGSGYGSAASAAYSMNMAFQSQRVMLFRDYEIMDCVSADTKIPLCDGTFPTIKELSIRESKDPFYVFSYDVQTNSIKLGLAHHVISKGTRSTVKLTFDSGKTLVCTPDHMILMRDGHYKAAKDIIPSDRVMPFYQKDFYNNGYRCIYNFDKGWESEHRIIAVECYDDVEVFDMTVDQYHNFATDQCFVHNCDPILSNACDIYAEESTTKNEYGKVLTIECDDEQVKSILENLYYDILNIEFNLYMWVRSLAKYGDFFLFLQISPEYGVYSVLPLSVYDTVRVEGTQINNPEYVYFETMGATGRKTRLENFQVAHFRLLGDANFLPYGKSMLEGARRIYRQLVLSEDAMLIHRIMRAPEKRVFKIDIANIPPAEVDAFMQKMADKQKKVPFMDPTSGEYNLQYNMQNILEDFYIPVRGGDTGTDIQNLGGLEYNAIDDIEYLRNKMMAALKIPKAFLGYDETIAGTSVLSAQDIRFGRTIERIQRIVESELYKIGVVHLYSQGHTDEELVSFKISLTTPSTIYEQEKVNLWKEKVDLAKNIIEAKLFSTNWIYENIFEVTPDVYERERELVILDVKRNYRMTQIEAGASDPQKFGFPQDKPAPALPPGQEGGGTEGGEGQPAAQPPVAEGTEKGPGQPKKGMSYGQDSFPRGRDMLGVQRMHREAGQKQDRTYKKKFPLAMESILQQIDKTLIPEAKYEILNENDTLEGTYMDESALRLPKK